LFSEQRQGKYVIAFKKKKKRRGWGGEGKKGGGKSSLANPERGTRKGISSSQKKKEGKTDD